MGAKLRALGMWLSRVLRSFWASGGAWLLIPLLFWILFFVPQALEPLRRGTFTPVRLAPPIRVSDPDTGEAVTLTLGLPRLVTVDPAVTQVLSLDLPPCPSCARETWFIAVEVGQGAFLTTDASGHPLPAVALEQERGEASGPSYLYLRPAGPSEVTKTVSLRLWLADATGVHRMSTPLYQDSMAVESGWAVSFFRFARLAAQPTLLAALLTGLAGFGVERWKRWKEDERRQKDRIMGEIDALGQYLRQGCWIEALARFRDYRQRQGLAWADKEVRSRLQEIWEHMAPKELQEYERYREEKRVRPDPSTVKEVTEVLLWATQNLGGEEYIHATEMLAGLLNGETIATVAEVLEAAEETGRRWLQDRAFDEPLQKIKEQGENSITAQGRL